MAASADAELVADLLSQYASGGVAIETPIEPLDEDGRYEVSGDRVLLRAYLPSDIPASRRRALRRSLARLPLSSRPTVLRARRRHEKEWEAAWKDYFTVRRVGKRLVVRPSWRRYDPLPGDVVIDIDPGMAFGTGDHPTTRMCLALVDDLLARRPAVRVLDLGTGSGILAIAAAKLGARSVLALDIEAQAVEVAARNIEENSLSAVVQAARGSLGRLWPPDVPQQTFDLILVNISAATISLLADDLAEALAPDGVIVASGIVLEKLADVEDRLRSVGLMTQSVMTEGDWCAVVVTRSD